MKTKGELIKYLQNHPASDDTELQFFFEYPDEGSFTLGIWSISQIFDNISSSEEITFLQIELNER